MPYSVDNTYRNITAAATTVCKAGSGNLHTITLNNLAASSVVTIFDNTAGSGTIIGTFTQAAAVSAVPITLTYDVRFNIGLTIVTTNTNDITVSFN